MIKEDLYYFVSSALPYSVGIIVLFILIDYLGNRRQLINPIQKATKTASTFVESKTVISPKLEAVHTRDEIELLSQSTLEVEYDLQD